MKMTARVGTQTNRIASVWRNLRLIENQMVQKPSGLIGLLMPYQADFLRLRELPLS